MGIAPHPYKHEWSPLVRQADGKIDLSRTYQNIQQMNAAYPCWGTMAQEASKEVLNATGRYDALLQLHRTLQLLIRLRDALESGLRRIEFGAL